MTRHPLTDMVGTSRRLRRKHAASALARLATADPVAYEALVDAGELDPALAHAAEHQAGPR